MSKKITYAIGGIVAIILLIGVGLFMVTQLVDPNSLKPEIIQSVKKMTGRDLTIDGDLTWSFFPGIGIEASKVTLSNRSGFTPAAFASVDTLTLDLSILPLILTRSVILQDIAIDGAVINLTTLANGQNNWDDLLGAPNTSASASTNASTSPATSTNTSASTASSSTPSAAPSKPHFNIAKLDVSNSSITWDDKQKNQHWDISELSIDGDDVSFSHAFPVSMSAKVYDPATDVTSYWDIKTDAHIDPDKNQYEFSSLTMYADLQGSAIPDGKQKVKLTLSKVKLDGNTKLFTIHDLIFDGFGSHATGNLISDGKNHVSGQFNVDQVLLGKFKMTDVSVPVDGNKGLYRLSPVTSKLYSGSFTSNITLDITPSNPLWKVDYKIAQVQLQQYLSEVFNHNRFSGTGNMSGIVSTSGLNESQMLSTLSGSTRIEISNGALEGIDIAYWWHMGDQLLRGNPLALGATNTKRTEIVNLSGNFTLKNGVATTNNIQMYNKIIFVTGQGTIDLVNQTVNLKLMVSENKNGQPSGTPIPLIMSGKFGDATVTLDKTAILALAQKIGGAALNNVVTQNAGKVAGQAAPAVGDVLNKLLGK